MAFTLTDFDFDLPEELIAQRPAVPRDSARLLVYDRAKGTITDSFFSELLHFLPPQSTLVLNNSKVEKCRLRFGNIEIFVIEAVNDRTVRAMVFPGSKFKLGRTVSLADSVSVKVIDIAQDGLRTLELSVPLDDPTLDPYRLTPLPPYIAQDESLAEDYQTVYAKEVGSKAAPTAGLHFTSQLLNKVRSEHQVVEITLEVGLGTFAPVKSESLDEHHMHQEWFDISPVAAEQLNQAQHLTAVGTTCVRTLESAVTIGDQGRHFPPGRRATEIFITPGYQFKAVDALITNFHLPKSTLLMLVAAFVGYDQMRSMYAHAIEHKYRFYSFGDAMLIL